MTSELLSDYDRVQLSAHSLANQLADVAAMMHSQGEFPPADLGEKIRQHIEQEQLFRLKLEEYSRRCHLSVPEDFLQLSFEQLRPIMDATACLKRANSHLAALRNRLDAASCSPDIKRTLYAELAELASLMHNPQLPLPEEVVRFADYKDDLTAKVEQAIEPPPAIEPPEVPPAPAQQQPAVAEPLEKQEAPKENLHLGFAPPPANDFDPAAPAEPLSLPETTPVQPVPSDEGVAEDLIFDDIRSETATKQILTAAEMSERIGQLNQESQQDSQIVQQPESLQQSESTKSEETEVPTDSVFDEFDTPAQGRGESLNEQLRRETEQSASPAAAPGQFESATTEVPTAPPAFVFDPEVDYSHVQEYAEKAAESQNRFDRVSFLGRLIWELISLGEYSWAYQVSRCLYTNVDEDLTIPAPPAWLISLLTMGDHVRLSSGRIAREFNNIATQHRDEAIQIAKTPESPEAFLLRAALMRGTVTTASTVASDILRAFSIESNQTQLYNYCSRIASFASRASGLKLDQYYYRPGAASIESDARAIRSQVLTWKNRAFENILPYTISMPLFSRAHWSVQSSQALRHPELLDEWRARQVLQARIARLLQPIIENNLSQGALVEQEIRRLSHSVLLTETGTQAILSSTESIEIPGRDIYNYVQEAIEFASHWLVLAASYPGMESVLVPQEVNELRDEIDQRQNSVFLELKQLEKTHGAQSHRAALTACRRSMDRINQLFHPTEEPRISEVDPLCLLNAELLKIPGVTLDNDWQCNITPSTLEHQILTIMKHGFVSWEDAFDLQMKAGCYRAAHQLIKLDVFPDDKKEQYRKQLENSRQDNANSLYELVGQIRAKIAESQSLELLNPLESEKLVNQLNSIEERIPAEYRLDQLRSDLTQLWQHLETKKELELKKMQDRMSRLAGQQPAAPVDSDTTAGEPAIPPRPIDFEQPGSSDQSDSTDEDNSGDWAIDV